MNVTIKYFGQLRHLAGAENESRPLPEGGSLAALLKDTARKHDEQFAAMLFDATGSLRSSVMLLINDIPIDKENPPALKDGDQISLLPAIAGG